MAKGFYLYLQLLLFLTGNETDPTSYFIAETIKARKYTEIVIEKIMKEVEKTEGLLDELKEQKKGEIEEKFLPKIKELSTIEMRERENIKKILKEYLEKYPESNMVPEVMLRLAEIYFEDAVINYQNAMAEYQKNIEKGAEKDIFPPVKDYSESIKIYKTFLEKFPDHPSADLVLYLTGYCWYEMGAPEEAVNYFSKLVEEKFGSALYPETAFRLGEIYFNWNDFENAIYYYSMIERFPDSPFYDKALYKNAWSYYKLNDYDRAIDYFMRVIKYQETHKVDISLIEESKEYLAISIMEKMGIEEAEKYLISQKSSEDFAKSMLLRIARIYHERGEIEKAIDVLQYYIKENPYDISLPEIFDTVSRYYAEMGKLDMVVKWKEESVKRFSPDSPWFQKNKNIENAEKIISLVERNIIELAKHYHSLADKSGENQLYLKAISFYDLLINTFPKSTFSPDAHFFKAEILFRLKDFLLASEEYEKTTEVKDVENKYIMESAYNMIYSLDQFYREFKPTGAGLRNILGPYYERAIRYMDLFPFDPQTPSILYRLGIIFMENGFYPEAISLFNLIVDNYFTSDLLDDAVKNIIKIYVDTKNFEELYKTGLTFLSRPEIMTEELKDYITEIVGGSIFKSAIEKEKNKDYDGALSLYEEIIKLFPESELAEKSLYNIAVVKENKGDIGGAVEVLKLFNEKYPSSELSINSRFKLASLYDRAFDSKNAVKEYSFVFEKFPQSKEAKFALFNLAQINYDLGNCNDAIYYINLYLSRYHEDAETHKKFTLNLAECLEREGKEEETIKIYSDFIKKYPGDNLAKIIIYNWMARYFDKKGEQNLAVEYYKKLLDIYLHLSSEDKVKFADRAGEAKFYLVHLKYKEFAEIKLELPVKKMEKLLEKKAKLLKDVVNEFMEIPKIGDPFWASASLYFIAKAYKDFSDALFTAPTPPELKTQEEIDIYREQLELQAMPVEEKAIASAQKAIEFAEKTGIENEWVHRARLLLQELKPGFEIKRGDEKLVIAEDSFYYIYPDTSEKTAHFAKLRIMVKEKKDILSPLIKGMEEEFYTVTRSQDLGRFKKTFYIVSPY